MRMFAIGLAESCGSGTLAVSPFVIQTVGDALVASRTVAPTDGDPGDEATSCGQRVQFRFICARLCSRCELPVEVDMDWSRALGTGIAVGCLAGGVACESVDARMDDEAAPETIPEVAPEAIAVVAPQTDSEVVPQANSEVVPEADPEQYRISVEIPVDDVTIARGENLDVDAMLDERTAFAAADFHLREAVLVARSRRGGSAELLIGEWASGAVDIPLGDAGSWYEVRIPAADVDDAGVEWVVDFTGALDLNLLVVVLEPRAALLAAATATVREVVIDEPVVVEDPSVEVVQAVEVVEPAVATPTVVREVAVVEQPVYRTETVYRYVDRPVYRYRVSWIYDPARYYVFRDYGGWTYRYFPGTWDWRCYNLSFRLPSHHHHRDSHRHRADRHDRRRFDRRDRDDHRGDRDRRRSDRDRDFRGRRDGDDRDRDRRGVRPRGNETRAVVSRPRAVWRQVDPGHPRIQLATQRRAEPRVEAGRRTNSRLRVSQGTGQQPNNVRATASSRMERATNPRPRSFQRRDAGMATSPTRNVPPRVEDRDTRRPAANARAATDRNARTRSFERRAAQHAEPRPTAITTPRPPIQRPPVANRTETSEPRGNARTRAFQRRPEQRAPVRTAPPVAAVSPRTTPVQQRSFQRQADPRRAAPTVTRSAEPPRRTVPSTANRQRATGSDRGNARTRTFQRRPEPRVTEPQRQRVQPRVQSRPRSMPPVRSTPPRETSRPSPRPQRAAPSRNTPQRERPVQRAPAKPQQSDSASDARRDEGSRSNARTRAFERR